MRATIISKAGKAKQREQEPDSLSGSDHRSLCLSEPHLGFALSHDGSWLMVCLCTAVNNIRDLSGILNTGLVARYRFVVDGGSEDLQYLSLET